MLSAREKDILLALQTDLGKPAMEAWGSEISLVADEITAALAGLASWNKPERVGISVIHQPGEGIVYWEPLGVVLIIGAWNYPVQLILAPLVAAIAAGNTAVLKPSEMAAATSRLLAEAIAATFEPDYVTVVEGDAGRTQQLLQEKFDHIFFTGSTSVGRQIMHAAAEQLTPVTLELGGKCPVIVDQGTSIETAAKRIVWGKCYNAGQTCLAPDYLLVHDSLRTELIEAMHQTIGLFYGQNPRQSPDYGRIINEHHVDRLAGLMDGGTIISGGEVDRAERYISPTLLEEVDRESALMKEEIFGPLLPIIPYRTLDEALSLVRTLPPPLAVYYFGGDEGRQTRVLNETRAGGGCYNDVLLQVSSPEIPFGGVGTSGFGRYHGRAGFETFSNRRGVLRKKLYLDMPLRYPPYGGKFDLVRMIVSAVGWLKW